MDEARVRGFSIATKCATIDELIEKFRDRVDEDSIVINTVEGREVGTECAFAILLADRKVALAGTCVVRDVYADTNNPFKRRGMRLAIKRLGPESQKVFARLVAVRAPRTAKPRRDATQPIVGMRAESPAAEVAREPARRPPSVPMPASHAAAEALARAPRATPYQPGSDTPGRPRPTSASLQVTAEGSAQPMLAASRAASAPAQATRAPGSPVIVPANPFTNLSDGSLEDYVDGHLVDASDAVAPPAPARADEVARRAARPTVPEPYQRARTMRGAPEVLRPAAAALDGQRSEPLPLPPPPQADEPGPPARAVPPRPPAAAAAASTAIVAEVARAPEPPAPSRRRRARFAARLDARLGALLVLIPLLGAGAVVLYTKLVRPPAIGAVTLLPAESAVADDPIYARAFVEVAPAAATPQRLHTVLVKTIPIAARVTVGERDFGRTPTFVEVPANTPVELEISRPGFRSVTYPLLSKRPNGRVLVRLQRATRGGR